MTCLRCVTPSTCSWNGCSPGTWPSENAAMPQTPAERQEARRARLLMEGRTEVRGIYAPPDLHAAIKEAARKMVEKHKPKEQK